MFSSFFVFADGGKVWVDDATGLMWYKCYYGQNLINNKCDGQPTKINWPDIKSTLESSNIAQYDDWRLPTQSEINLFRSKAEFKADANLGVWSSSDDGYNAWYIKLDTGMPMVCSQTDQNYAIIVRSASKEEKARSKREMEEEKARLKREMGLSPQAMYLQAGKYEREGNASDAKRLYETLIEKHPNHPLAIKANDQLLSVSSGAVSSYKQSDSDDCSQLYVGKPVKMYYRKLPGYSPIDVVIVGVGGGKASARRDVGDIVERDCSYFLP